MDKIRITLPVLHKAQQDIMENARRFTEVAMGEQGGKTTLGIEALVASKRGAVFGSAPVAWF